VNRYLPARLPPHVAESAASASTRRLSHPSPTSSFRDNLAPPDQGPAPLNLDSLHLPTGLCRSPPPSSTSSPLTRAQVVTPRRLQLLLPPPATPSRRRIPPALLSPLLPVKEPARGPLLHDGGAGRPPPRLPPALPLPLPISSLCYILPAYLAARRRGRREATSSPPLLLVRAGLNGARALARRGAGRRRRLGSARPPADNRRSSDLPQSALLLVYSPSPSLPL
jgi:hypothetical protein